MYWYLQKYFKISALNYQLHKHDTRKKPSEDDGAAHFSVIADTKPNSSLMHSSWCNVRIDTL